MTGSSSRTDCDPSDISEAFPNGDFSHYFRNDWLTTMARDTRANKEFSQRTQETARWAREQIKRQAGKSHSPPLAAIGRRSATKRGESLGEAQQSPAKRIQQQLGEQQQSPAQTSVSGSWEAAAKKHQEAAWLHSEKFRKQREMRNPGIRAAARWYPGTSVPPSAFPSQARPLPSGMLLHGTPTASGYEWMHGPAGSLSGTLRPPKSLEDPLAQDLADNIDGGATSS